jgi:hypothetical protein
VAVEANILSSMFMIPLLLARMALPGEIQELYDYLRELTDIRKAVYEWFRR